MPFLFPFVPSCLPPCLPNDTECHNAATHVQSSSFTRNPSFPLHLRPSPCSGPPLVVPPRVPHASPTSAGTYARRVTKCHRMAQIRGIVTNVINLLQLVARFWLLVASPRPRTTTDYGQPSIHQSSFGNAVVPPLRACVPPCLPESSFINPHSALPSLVGPPRLPGSPRPAGGRARLAVYRRACDTRAPRH